MRLSIMITNLPSSAPDLKQLTQILTSAVVHSPGIDVTAEQIHIGSNSQSSGDKPGDTLQAHIALPAGRGYLDAAKQILADNVWQALAVYARAHLRRCQTVAVFFVPHDAACFHVQDL